GKINREKGLYAEYFIIQQLRYRAYKNDLLFQSFTHNLENQDSNYSLICEVKNREKKFSKKDAEEFSLKLEKLIKSENIKNSVGLIFSNSGFTPTAINFLKENNFAYSDDAHWFDDNN
ncbi:MAG: hypothetical protein B6I31_05445, partial [Desulfobacteraceae bacterium 4572_19]